MKLPFLLPDFTRIIWHSEAARQAWQPRISAINAAWSQMELGAVAVGNRRACLNFIDPAQLVTLSHKAAGRGLTVLPLTMSGIVAQYSATPKALVAGQPWQYRVVVLQPQYAQQWLDAWQGQSDNKTIGMLLGYPECCRDFFERVWVEGQGVDTSWEMAEGTEHHRRTWDRGEELRIEAGLPPESNILLRWLGTRLVPHLPCSFNCEATVENGKQYAEVGRKLGFDREVDWLYEMLEWPVEWSALHGIAEVRTPVLTVSTRTDATAGKRVVQRAGTKYPDEGASGLRFPFRIVKGKVTDKPAFKRSLLPVHELNGFGSEASMNAAHDALLSVLPQNAGTLLDLGCGNGRLLERAVELGWKASGVEVDGVRAGAGTVPIRRGNILDTATWDGQYDVVAFMPGRLLEAGAVGVAESVRQALYARAGAVLLYAYGDWLSKYGSLGPLMAEAGLGSGEVVKSARGDGVEAALVTFARAAAPV